MDQPSACLPAGPFFQRDDSFEPDLQVGVLLFEPTVVPLKDSLLDPGDLEADLRVELRRTQFSSPVVERRPGPL